MRQRHLIFPGSMYLFAGLYALGAEILLALTVLTALLRQLRGALMSET